MPVPAGEVPVREAPGPPGAPTIVLLHGATLNAELNWSGVLEALGRRYRVLAPDLRGHGGGPPTGRFSLEDCADDVAALAAVLGVRRVVPVGFSMGGMVAQLLWRRHRDLVAGLVLCSTARNVCGSLWERSASVFLPGLVAAASWTPAFYGLRADVVGAGLLDADTPPAQRRWAIDQMRRTSLLSALSTIHAVSGFTSHRWIGSVDVPTAVVLTRRDRVVPARRQATLAAAVPGCVVHEIDADHGVFLGAPAEFAAALDAACAGVLDDAGAAAGDVAS